MYHAIRFLVAMVLMLLITCLIRQSGRQIRRKGITILAVVCVLCGSLLDRFPVENKLFAFSSPEEVFRYTNFERICDVVYGRDSCMVIYSSGPSTYSHAFVGRSQDSYFILPQYSGVQLARNFKDARIINTYRVKNTDDYYIVVFFDYGTEVELFNGSGKVDTHIVECGESGYFSTFYVYVENLSEEHYLLVDEEVVNIIG